MNWIFFFFRCLHIFVVNSQQFTNQSYTSQKHINIYNDNIYFSNVLLTRLYSPQNDNDIDRNKDIDNDIDDVNLTAGDFD